MKYPLIILAGKKGSGKDTAASLLAKQFNGVTIAQADPIKRFLQKIFPFTDEMLWGPSAARETKVQLDESAFDYVWNNVDGPHQVFTSIQNNQEWLTEIGLPLHRRELHRWMRDTMNSARTGFAYGKPVYELTPRSVLQTLGTEFARRLYPNIWIDYAIKTAQRLLTEGGTYDPKKGIIPGPERPSVVIITDGRFRNEILRVKELGGAAVLVVNPEEKPTAPGTHASEAEQDTIPEWWYTCKVSNDKKLGVDNLGRTMIEVGNFLEMWRPTSFGRGGR